MRSSEDLSPSLLVPPQLDAGAKQQQSNHGPVRHSEDALDAPELDGGGSRRCK